MKKILFYAMFIGITSSLMTSCQKDTYEARVSQVLSIASLRDMYKGEPTRIEDQKNKEVLIGGIVISATAHQNNPEGRLIVQNHADGKLRGIALAIEGQIGRYQPGDSILAKIDGALLERKEGILQVSGLSVADVGRISLDNTQIIHVTTDNFQEISANRDVYEATLVKLTAVDAVDPARGQKFGDEELVLTDGSINLNVKTRTTATFAGANVPESGDFTAILLYSEAAEPYLSIRSAADYTGVYAAPDEYTGFPEGWENIIGVRKAGSVSTSGYDEYPSGRWRIFQALSRGLDPQFHNTRGSWTMMMSGVGESHVGMEFDLLFGASKFSFYYGAATRLANDAGVMNLLVEYSTDSGQTWQQVGPKFTIPNDPARPQHFAELDNLDIQGTVRFRIRKEAGGGRVTIDDIYVQPNT